MKFKFIISVLLLLVSCNKPKTVLICGDHVCINKAEAEQFFEENLTIEVKILDKKMKKNLDLVELNLRDNPKGPKSISITSKADNNKRLKTLSNNEITKIKEKIKKKANKKKYISKKDTDDNKTIISTKINEKKNNSKIKELSIKNVNKNKIDVADICTILEKCSIDEISKYLLKKGKNKEFPDITKRQSN